jgi:hypothetical protein
MNEQKNHEYEARVWKDEDGQWSAKVLRNECYYDSRSCFASRDKALAWAQETADADRLSVAHERKAERVTL